jgi:hypothetical protein
MIFHFQKPQQFISNKVSTKNTQWYWTLKGKSYASTNKSKTITIVFVQWLTHHSKKTQGSPLTKQYNSTIFVVIANVKNCHPNRYCQLQSHIDMHIRVHSIYWISNVIKIWFFITFCLEAFCSHMVVLIRIISTLYHVFIIKWPIGMLRIVVPTKTSRLK